MLGINTVAVNCGYQVWLSEYGKDIVCLSEDGRLRTAWMDAHDKLRILSNQLNDKILNGEKETP